MDIFAKSLFKIHGRWQLYSLPLLDLFIFTVPVIILCNIYEPSATLFTVLYFLILGMAIIIALDGYNLELRYALYQQIGFVAVICFLLFAFSLLMRYFLSDLFASWQQSLKIVLLVGLCLIFSRKIFTVILVKCNIHENIYIFGRGWIADLIAEEVKKKENLGLKLSGTFDLESYNDISNECIKPYFENNYLDKDELVTIVDARNQSINLAPGRLSDINHRQLLQYPGNVIHAQDFFEIHTRRIPMPPLDYLESVEVSYLRTRKKIHDFIWSFFNVTCAIAGLILSLPIWIVIALSIKIEDQGEVFFVQDRVGLGGNIFKIFKFRTMEDSKGNNSTIDRPKQITRVGSVIRKFRFDELPQFINILRRELNFVGPRPFVISEARYFESRIPLFQYRYLVLPGITGLAQVSHRYENELCDAWTKLGYDLYYVKNRGYFLDILIMMWTFGTVVFGRGK